MYVSFLIFGLVALAHGKRPVLSEELEEMVEMIHNECVSSTGIAEEDIQNCDKGIFKDDPKLKCYMFCLFEEASLVEDDGSINYDMLLGILPDPYNKKMEASLSACKEHDALDKEKCQRAFDVHKCLYAQDPEHYILF